MPRNWNEYLNKKYSKLTVKEIILKNNRYYFHCICECGTEKDIRSDGILYGTTHSCGCLYLQRSKEAKTKHGLRKHHLYPIWNSMMARCFNENHYAYKYYGARGIVVSSEWKDFKVFLIDMEDSYSKGLSIGRIDNDGNYCKENCRWETWTEQNNNKRNNIIFEFNGMKKTLKQWSEYFSINYQTVYDRMFTQNLSFEKTMRLNN